MWIVLIIYLIGLYILMTTISFFLMMDIKKSMKASRIIRDIKGDCKAMNKAMINIPLIFDINGRSADEAAADLAGIIKAINKREFATVPASSRCEPGWARLVEKLS